MNPGTMACSDVSFWATAAQVGLVAFFGPLILFAVISLVRLWGERS